MSKILSLLIDDKYAKLFGALLDPVVPSSLQPHRQGPTRLLCPWNSPGKNSPGVLPNPGIEAGSVSLLTDSLPPEPQGSTVRISKLEKLSTAVTYPEFYFGKTLVKILKFHC